MSTSLPFHPVHLYPTGQYMCKDQSHVHIALEVALLSRYSSYQDHKNEHLLARVWIGQWASIEH